MKPVTDPAILALLNQPVPVDRETALKLEEAELRQQDFDSMSRTEQMLVGAGQSVDELVTGARGLFGGDTSQARADQQMVDSVEGGWKTAGKVAGDVGMASIPGIGLAGAVGRTAPLATRTAAGLAGDAWGAGVVEGIQNEDALTGAIAAGTTAAVGGGLPKALGLGGSKAAQELTEQGVKLTPGQRWGGIVQGVEEIMSYVPGFSKPVQRAKERALASWNQVIRGNKKAPQEAMKDIKSVVKAEYDDIFQGTAKLEDGLFGKWADTLSEASEAMAPKEFKQLQKLFANFSDPIAKGRGSMSGNALQTLHTNLGKMMNQAYRRGDSIAGDAFKSAKAALTQSMPEGMSSRLAQNNKAYSQFKVLESVTAKAAPMKRSPPGTFYPSEGMTSAAAGRRPQAAVGQAPLQKEFELANEVLQKENPVQGLAARVPAFTRPLLNRGTQALATSQAAGTLGRRIPSLAAGTLMSGLYDPEDPNDKMRLIAEELRRRR